MAARIRKDDMVVVRSGADRGKTGKVLAVYPDKDKVLVEGINVKWKHIRPSDKNRRGGRIEKPAPLPMGKVQPIDPATNKGCRVRFVIRDGQKYRVAAKTGSDLGVVGRA
ncbi:MAG: 50S ribosomal protein L24 [Phycisphaerae bacterium]